MTTNKPEVVAYSWQYHGRHSTVDKKFADELVADGEVVDPLVRLSDYEALQAECEKLRKVADQYRRLLELGEDFHWENIIRVDISDYPSRADAIDAAVQEPSHD